MRPALIAVLLLAWGCDDRPRRPAETAPDTPAKVAKSAPASVDAGTPAIAHAPDAASAAAPVVADGGARTAEERAKQVRTRPKGVDLRARAKQRRELIRKGRQLSKGGQYAEAIAAFQELLQVDRQDVSALGELSWAAVRAGQLDLAKRSAQSCIDVFGTPDAMESSCLFNLGLALEAEGDRAAAAGAYRRAHGLRASKAVRERLRATDPWFGALSVRQAELALALAGALSQTARDHVPGGTFADEAALCQPLLRHWRELYADDDGDTDTEPDCRFTKGPMPVGGGLQEAAIVELSWDGQSCYPGLESYLALRQAERWMLVAALEEACSPGAGNCYVDAEVKSLEVHDVIPGGAPEVVVVSESGGTDRDEGIDEVSDWSETHMVIGGLGPEGPTCLLRLLTASHYSRERLGWIENEDLDPAFQTRGLPLEESITLAVDLTTPGRIAIAKTGGRNAERELLVGSHSAAELVCLQRASSPCPEASPRAPAGAP